MRMLRPMLHRNVCMREPDAVLLAQHAGEVEPDHQRGGGRVDRERAATLGLIRVVRGQARVAHTM
jgi:hypothetical protein